MKDIATWRKEKLKRLREEAVRPIEAIDLANNPVDLNEHSSRRIASVKRHSLNLNEAAVVIRKGYYADYSNK